MPSWVMEILPTLFVCLAVHLHVGWSLSTVKNQDSLSATAKANDGVNFTIYGIIKFNFPSNKTREQQLDIINTLKSSITQAAEIGVSALSENHIQRRKRLAVKGKTSSIPEIDITMKNVAKHITFPDLQGDILLQCQIEKLNRKSANVTLHLDFDSMVNSVLTMKALVDAFSNCSQTITRGLSKDDLLTMKFRVIPKLFISEKVTVVLITMLQKNGKSINWSPKLRDPKSKEYLKLSKEVCDYFDHMLKYSKNPDLKSTSCDVTNFFSPSVAAVVKLQYYTGQGVSFDKQTFAETILDAAKGYHTVNPGGIQQDPSNKFSIIKSETELAMLHGLPTTNTPNIIPVASSGKKTVVIIKVELTTHLRMDGKELKWHENMTIPTSPEYKKAYKELCEYNKKMLIATDVARDKSVHCLNTVFRKGSVISQSTVEYTAAPNGPPLQAARITNSLKAINKLYAQVHGPAGITYDSNKPITLKVLSPGTCDTHANTCSPHAKCVDTFKGYRCICKRMWINADPRHPGKSCRLSNSALALIITVSLFILAFVGIMIGMCAAAKRRPMNIAQHHA